MSPTACDSCRRAAQCARGRARGRRLASRLLRLVELIQQDKVARHNDNLSGLARHGDSYNGHPRGWDCMQLARTRSP